MAFRAEEADALAKTVRDAIREELRASSRGLAFRAWDVSRERGLLHMTLEPEGRRSVLDESLEDGRMSWRGEAEGSAEVVSVLPAVAVVNACLSRGTAPREGSLVYLNPPAYLEALAELWDDGPLAGRLARWYFELGENRVEWEGRVPHARFGTLRPAQRRAFDLVRWRTSFLWGPPGTGKTHTLGRLVAAYLMERPADRVLLLSSTNVAVDLAILAVDDALEEARHAPRPVCLRFGSRLDPRRFSARKHLTPLRDKTLVERLRRHYEAVPDPSEADRYHAWRRVRDALREAIRKENLEFLAGARLAAMTTTLAAHDFAEVGRFDLVVFDEASQVGKAQAMTFAHLGKRALFAGDPRQLAPISQASGAEAANWLGRSPFEWMDRAALRPAACMLDEQWRMAEPIGRAVSDLFYESKLRVAEPAARDAAWAASRTARPTRLLGAGNVVLVDTGAAAVPAEKFRGYQCPESARLAAALVADHALAWGLDDLKRDILALTPYRAQRRRVEDELRSIGAPAALASTVHRAQGSERKVVIFDPVCPTAEFVSDAEGLRLVNVAMSRAQCRLIVMLQRGWERHAVLRRMAERHAPVKLDADGVDRLLLSKLAQAKAERPAPERAGPRPKPTPLCLRDQFRQELLEMGARGAPAARVRQLAQSLRDKAKFRRLPFGEIDTAIGEILGGAEGASRK